MRADELDPLFSQMREAVGGPPEVYAAVLERALAACGADPVVAAEYLDALELHSELVDVYDQMGRVEAALRHADVLVEEGYECEPDPRCRRAEILTRHGRLAEAAAIWRQLERDTPDDVWLYNNAGLEYGDVGEHELALEWLTKGLELAIRTGDPERLVGQLRDLRVKSLAALGREPDRLQTVEPRTVPPPPAHRPRPAGQRASAARDEDRQMPVAWAWLPAEEYPHLEEHWSDIAGSPAVRDAGGGVLPHAEYCRRMEGRLREAGDAGVSRIRIAPLRWPEYTTWLEQSREEGDPADLRARYVADLCRDPARVITWPLSRNEGCWCGSGRKYKKCCAAPGPGGAR